MLQLAVSWSPVRSAVEQLEWVRDYRMSIDKKFNQEDSYVLAINDKEAVYNQIERKFNLTRSSFLPKSSRPSKLTRIVAAPRTHAPLAPRRPAPPKQRGRDGAAAMAPLQWLRCAGC